MSAYHISSLPATQALTSPTFKPPPFGRALPEIYDWHWQYTKEHAVFVFADELGRLQEIKWPQVVQAVHNAGHLIRTQLKVKGDGTPKGTPVVALITASDAITYFTTIVGIMRAGYAAFPISTRNTPAAVAHVLTKSIASHVLVGRDEGLVSLTKSAFALMDGKIPGTSSMPVFEELYSNTPLEKLDYIRPEKDTPAVILHSAGSTALPKPRIWTHSDLMELSLVPYFGDIDMCGMRLACHGLPMYHGLGLMQIGWTATCGLVMTTFKPQQPAILPTPDNVLKGSMDTSSDILFCVPSFIEHWYHHTDSAPYLRSIHGLLYSGAPLNKEVGNGFTVQGVKLYLLYGCTEVGVMSPTIPNSTKSNWDYFSLSLQSRGEFIPHGSGKSELVILKSNFQTPAVVNGQFRGEDAYWTGDLFTAHPTQADLWKFYGRKDDIIIHNTGEKTNPVPLESILTSDAKIAAAVMFGQGRFNVGVIIAPKAESKFDPKDHVRLAEFRNAIWSTAEKMNKSAPQHSRLFKEMILVELPSKPFTYTAKTTPRRQAVINDYEREIESLYEAFEEATRSNVPLPHSWDLGASLKYIETLVMQVRGRKIERNEDLFENGVDSLQATWIRNALINAFRSTIKADTGALSNHLVYQYPNIQALASFASSFAGFSNELQPSVTGEKNMIQTMTDMAGKYSNDFKTHKPSHSSLDPPTGYIVLITGTTGGLGASLLSHLAMDEQVSHIYALNRRIPRGKNIMDYHEDVFSAQGLSFQDLPTSKIYFVEADLSLLNFGLPVTLFEDMRNRVTHIVHNAWRVDFNASLKTFEKNLSDSRTLVDLALSSPMQSPPSIIFISSIGVLQNADINDEIVVGPEAAITNGYTQSKWCTEQLLSHASAQTPLRTATVRIGQICGLSSSGYWKTSEWLPSMVKSSIYINMLPSCPQSVSWIPMEIASKVVTELTFSQLQSGELNVFHVAHPRPTSWSSIFETMSRELGVPLVTYNEWLDCLEATATTGSRLFLDNPASRMTQFYRFAATCDLNNPRKEAMGLTAVSMDHSRKVSLTLARSDMGQLNAENVKQWLSFWTKVGFIGNERGSRPSV